MEEGRRRWRGRESSERRRKRRKLWGGEELGR